MIRYEGVVVPLYLKRERRYDSTRNSKAWHKMMRQVEDYQKKGFRISYEERYVEIDGKTVTVADVEIT